MVAFAYRWQEHLKQRRAVLIQELGQIEDWLGYHRSIPTRKERKA